MDSVMRGCRSGVVALLVALTLAATPVRAAEATSEPEGWGKVLRYSSCALMIAGSTGGVLVAAAVVGCLVLLHDEAY
jgi:hypothetical protein